MTVAIRTAAAAVGGADGPKRSEPGPSWSRPDDDATLRDGAPEKIARCAFADWWLMCGLERDALAIQKLSATDLWYLAHERRPESLLFS